MQRLTAKIYGQVQGVFYRRFVTKGARKLNLTGWVKNTEDGAVEIMAEGTEENLLLFLDSLHEGSPASQVERVEDEWQAATGEFPNFQQLC